MFFEIEIFWAKFSDKNSKIQQNKLKFMATVLK